MEIVQNIIISQLPNNSIYYSKVVIDETKIELTLPKVGEMFKILTKGIKCEYCRLCLSPADYTALCCENQPIRIDSDYMMINLYFTTLLYYI